MGVCDVPVISSVCDAVGEGAASLVAAPFDWLAQAMGAAAGWLFEAVWSVFDTTTLVDVTKPGYIAVYNLLFGIAVFVMLIFFCLQLITGLIRRDPTALTRAALGLAKSCPRIVRGHHAHGAAAGSRRPAVHRDRAGSRRDH